MNQFEPNYGMGIAMDAHYALFIWHDGQPTELGVAVTAATITVTADTSITLKINAAVDTRIGSSGVIAHATWGTWGLIMQHINGVLGWHCVLRDGLFDGLPDGMNTVSETTCYQLAVGVSTDDSDDFQMGIGIANYKAGTTMEGVQACLYYVTGQITSTNAAPLFQIYECDDRAGTEQLVRQFKLTTATEHAFPTNGPVGMPIFVAKPGNRILVMFEGVDNLTAGRAEVIGGLKQVA